MMLAFRITLMLAGYLFVAPVLASPIDQFWRELPNKKTEELVQLLESKIWFERIGALSSLYHRDKQQAILWSRKLINDSSLLVRSKAAQLLAQSQDPEDLDRLQNELYHERNFYKGRSLFIRREIVLGLLKTAKDRLDSTWIKKLKEDPDQEIRKIAEVTYGKK